MNTIGLFMLIKREYDRMLRVVTQVFISPWISAFLFIFIFGSVLGKKIDLIAGVPYISFVFPGILMMNVIQSAFLASSSAVYFGRFLRSIEEMLVAPFSYFEMILGYVLSAVIRTVIIAIGIVVIGFFFGALSFSHPILFLLYTIGIAVIFSLLGIIVGLWANGFEQLNILNTFVIMPFSFLGGMFYSLSLLPPNLVLITQLNPFFYFVDGMRYAMIGHAESNLLIGGVVIAGLAIFLSVLVWYLFKISWRIRE